MRRLMIRRLLFFGLLILLAACEPGDLVDLPTAPSRITILSLNQVGIPWTILVTPSASRSGFPIMPTGLPGAEVTLYEDGNFLEKLEYDTISPEHMASVFFSTTNSPRAGHHYKIVVEADGYPTATAEYTQPDPVPTEVTFELSDRKTVMSQHAYTDANGTRIEYVPVTLWTFDVTITFTDPPGDNFYDFWIESARTEDSLGVFIGGYLQQSDRPAVDYILDGMIDDKDIAGSRVTRRFKCFTSDNKSIPGMSNPSWFRISLRSMTEAEYKFITQSRKSQISNQDPYAQPITTFTNVENGLGVFGGFTPYSTIIHYEPE